ncbi:MAG: mannose-6-phosphate isomerase, class I, partial [Natronosporangium sp.]
WVGAHPSTPSVVEATGVALTDLIAAAPERALSARVAHQFGPRLPYLLKLLAADAPLSLQAHPDPDQAAAGYAAEEAAGVPRDAPHRRYVDPYHKPELLVAVSEFRALCGFRAPAAAAEVVAGLAVPALSPLLARLRADDLPGGVRWLLAGDRAPVDVAEVAAAAADRPGYPVLGELATAYPGDRGVLVTLLLNQVTLAPGEAIFMPAGNLHVYLHGTGVEIMAASDNVLRGGLTGKYVDLPELLRVLRYEPLLDPVRRPVPVAPGVVTWPVPVPDLALHRVRLDAGVPAVRLPLPGPRTVLCLAGELRVDDGAPVTLRPGEAAFGEACELNQKRSGEACELNQKRSGEACELNQKRSGGAGERGWVGFTGTGEAYVATVGAARAA